MARKTRRSGKKDLAQLAFTRFMIVVAFFVLWIGGIGVRLVYLQINQHEQLREKAVSLRRDIKQTKLLRGTIYDRNERMLAISVPVKTLFADPTKIEDIPAAAKILSRALKLNERSLRAELEESRSLDRRFLPIAKGLDNSQADEINRILERSDIKKPDLPRYPGLYWREDQKRSYPHRTLAAHVVGFADSDGVGQAGVERSSNDALFGAVIRRNQQRDRLGRVYNEVVTEKEPPKDVVLTIDSSTQFIAERALERAVQQSNARSGVAIVMANKTGEIFALANYPTFDPNRLDGINASNLTNHAVQSMYSPGSVFKLVTYGAALERDLIEPEGFIDAGSGIIEIANRRFRDVKALGRVTYKRAMAVSSNVCAIRTGMRVGKEGFHSMVREFGFGERTGIELPAETPGAVRPPERWFGDSLASMSIGYEIGVSPLQMATAFATIANDGVRVRPHIVKEIRQSDEAIVSVTRPESTRVVSVGTAADLRAMLREVVLSGTGKRAQVEGYSTAGKTGTAWKFDEQLKRVNSAKYVSSFIGFAPAERPEVTIAVVIDEPKNGGRDGGAVAAPVFREIAEQMLPAMGIAQDRFEGADSPTDGEDGDTSESLAPIEQLAGERLYFPGPRESVTEENETPKALSSTTADKPDRPGGLGTRRDKGKRKGVETTNRN